MARKNRSLTDFSEVASEKSNIKIDDKKETNNNIELDNKKNTVDNTTNDIVNNIINDTKNSSENDYTNSIIKEKTKDIGNGTENNINKGNINSINNGIKKGSKLDDLISGKKEEKNVATMIHLEPEVAKILDKLSGVKKGRSGKKSKIVNEVLKEFFRSIGKLD